MMTHAVLTDLYAKLDRLLEEQEALSARRQEAFGWKMCDPASDLLRRERQIDRKIGDLLEEVVVLKRSLTGTEEGGR